MRRPAVPGVCMNIFVKFCPVASIPYWDTIKSIMRTKNLFWLSLLALSSAVSFAQVTTDFSSLAAGSVTATDLNSVTTGGVWFLNTSRGASFEIQEDGTGDKAILGDDPGGNGGTINFMALTVSAGNQVDLTTNIATFDFRVGTRRTGNNKGIRYEFLNQAGNAVIGTLDWNHNGNELVLNDGAVDEDSVTQTTGAGGEAFSGSFLGSWNSTAEEVQNVSVEFSGSTVTATFGSETLSASFLNSATDVGRVRVWTTGTATAAKGAFLDEVTLTTAPAPPLPYTDYHYRGLTSGDPDYVRDLIRVFLPPAGLTGVENRPAILMFHGGGWGSGSSVQFDSFCQKLADMGFVVATANYRYSSHSTASTFPDPKERCIVDARLATAWLAGKAADFGFAPDQIMLGGGSAGGHIATMVALMPDDLTAVAAAPVSIPALLLFNPAYHESEASGANSLRVDPERQLAALVADGSLPPPAIHFFGNFDKWRIPSLFINASGATENGIGRALPFIDACREVGAEAELWYALGEGHSFFNATNWLERCITEIDPFLTSLGIAPGEPVPAAFAHPERPLELATDLHAWRLEWFLNEAATGDATDDSNPDGDPFDNFTEFALGTSPLAADLPVPLNFDPATTTLRFSRRTHTYTFADPVTAVDLQWSPDLSVDSWLPFTIPPGSVVETTGNIESLAVPIDPDSAAARFFRLAIGPYTPSGG